MTIDRARELVAKWGSNHQEIRRILFFGSRVRGGYNDKSDLDIAIELAFEEPGNAYAYWAIDAHDWANELSEVLPWELDLELYVPGHTLTIENAIHEASVIVFDRAIA